MGEFDAILGPILIGAMFNMYLYGVVSTQYIRYHGMKFNDVTWIKAIVGFLFVLDTAQTTSIMYWVYDQMVIHFNDPSHLGPVSLEAVWPFPWTLLSNAINSSLAETVLTYRVYRLTKNRYLLAAFALLVATVITLGLFCSIRGFMLAREADYQGQKRILVPTIAWRICEVVLDLSLSATLIVILQRARTGNHRSEAIINGIVGHAIKTGVFMALYSITIAANVLAKPSVASCFVLSQGKVATNMLLTSLLKRQDYNKATEQLSASFFNRLDVESREDRTNSVELQVRKDIQKVIETEIEDIAGGVSDLNVGEVTFKKRRDLSQ